MSLTKTDLLNATNYASERLKLLKVKKIVEQYPHIGKRLEVTIRAATAKDYYIPLGFEKRAIVVNVKINKSLCERLSCNFATPTGPCTPESVARHYRVGDQDRFEVSCQPACFNLIQTPIINKENEQLVQNNRLTYYNNKCTMVSSSSIWAELPFFRSKERYETRINDLPTGFNYEEDKYRQSGMSYTLNKTYCESFFDEWVPEEKNCKSSTNAMGFITDVIIGESFIKMVKGGMTALVNDGNTIPDPGFSPPPPVDDKYKLENWLADNNPDYIEFDPDADLDILLEKQKVVKRQIVVEVENKKEGELTHLERLFETLNTLKDKCAINQYNISNEHRRDIELGVKNYVDFYNKSNISSDGEYDDLTTKQKRSNDDDDDDDDENKKNFKKIKTVHEATKFNSDLDEQINTLINNNKKSEENVKKKFTVNKGSGNIDEKIQEVPVTGKKRMNLYDLVIKLLESLFTDPLFISSIAVDVVFDKILDYIKNRATMMVKHAIPKLSRLALNLTRPIGVKIFNSSFKLSVGRMITQTTIKLASGIAKVLAKTAALACSVIGIVLIIISIMDLVFTLWDPLGFNNKYPPEYLQLVTLQAELAFRTQLETSSLEYNFDILSNIILTKDEIIELSLNSFDWHNEYSESLTVNSEGSRIDHGELVVFSAPSNDFENELHIETAKFSNYTPQDFQNFEHEFLNRVRFTGSLKTIGVSVLIVGIIVLVLQLHLVALLIIIISLIIMLVAKLNMDFDFLIKNIPQTILDQIFKYTNN
ncbi:P74 [Tipula oleracea nudivirus]|uniref:p74 n=1 Tax=Tipula oleracea nudivirus TaxID=1546257 RepID=A0A0B4VFD6_9VIRU|nr:P74 [Tipula oleracea nudivirus]AJD20105.1 P74 [Tipula oleracea nudivirus]